MILEISLILVKLIHHNFKKLESMSIAMCVYIYIYIHTFLTQRPIDP